MRPEIYCDEEVHGAVSRGLVRLGITATSAVAEKQTGISDPAQLAYSVNRGWCILTHNVEDFPRLHAEVVGSEEHHTGIIVCRQDLAIGEIIRCVSRLCATLSAEDMRDRLEYLGGW